MGFLVDGGSVLPITQRNAPSAASRSAARSGCSAARTRGVSTPLPSTRCSRPPGLTMSTSKPWLADILAHHQPFRDPAGRGDAVKPAPQNVREGGLRAALSIVFTARYAAMHFGVDIDMVEQLAEEMTPEDHRLRIIDSLDEDAEATTALPSPAAVSTISTRSATSAARTHVDSRRAPRPSPDGYDQTGCPAARADRASGPSQPKPEPSRSRSDEPHRRAL